MHIALVDDDPDQQALRRLLLESAGHSVSTFGSVATAIEGLKRARVDLLLVD